MPKVISYTPSWLSRPSPGFDLFSSHAGESTQRSNSKSVNGSSEKTPYLGARRILVKRGTEVFVVVGNTIRWADLALLKDDWENKSEHSSFLGRSRNQAQSTDEHALEGVKHKVLKVPVHEQIQQLVISPNEDLLAIVTSHTVHIAILPDSSHLDQPDRGPLKLKTHTLGPTIHVLSQSQVMSVLWHPLGASGQCVVTVTADAVVRLWELDKENRWSFNHPALDIDLTKLHYAKSAEDNVESVRIGDSRGFSLDTLGMEVAAATFGGSGVESEQGWSAMTLWIAMTEGDVYALSPLLPSKWRAPSTLIPSLSTSTVAKKPYVEGLEALTDERQVFERQYLWLKELDEQEPFPEGGGDGFAARMAIYNRPSVVGAIPKLQGPFRILPGDVEDDLDLAGILVIAPKLQANDLFGMEDDNDYDEVETGGLSTTVVCLVTRTGRTYICLNLEEVEGQWLPPKKTPLQHNKGPAIQPELILLEALDTMKSSELAESEWPLFSTDIKSRYSFYITHTQGVFFLSLDPWIEPLEKELQNEDPAGSGFRIGILKEGSKTLRERILKFDPVPGSPGPISTTACVLFQDSDLGYFLLTMSNECPQAVVLDTPAAELFDNIKKEDSPSPEYEPELSLIPAPPRPLFEPPPIFWNHKTALSTFLDTHVSKRHRLMLKEEVRLSSATLEVMTEAHRVLSQESQLLGSAAAEIFRRCERLQDELRDQIRRVNEIAQRVDKITGDDADEFSEQDCEYEHDGPVPRGSAQIELRLEAATERLEELAHRCDALRRKLGRLGGRPISDKEAAFAAEVDKYSKAVLGPEGDADEKEKRGEEGDEESNNEKAQDEGDADTSDREQSKTEPWQRYEEVQALASELIAQAKEMANSNESADTGANSQSSRPASVSSFRIPSEVRKTRMDKVMSLLERESALVDAAQERLGRLSLISAG